MSAITYNNLVDNNLATNFSGCDTDERILEIWLYGKSPRTQGSYKSVAGAFLEFVAKPLQTVTVADIFHWVEAIAPNLKPSSVKTKLYTIKSLLSFASKVGYCQFNVGCAIKPPKVADELHKKCLKVESIKAMADNTNRLRDSLLIRFAYMSGLRAAELSALTWGQFKDGKLYVTGKGTKNRTVIIPESFLLELLELKPINASDDSPVFVSRKKNGGHHGHLSRIYISKLIKDAAIKAGESNKVSAHWLRHSHAYNALKNGADIAVIRDSLGHASLVTTSKYVGLDPDDSSSLYLSI